jgi:aryl-alcohol dehydrogenase-like predicted oxidoreductase
MHPDTTPQNRRRYNPGRAQAAYHRYVELARDHGLDPATLAIAFAASRKFVTSVIIGATSMDQLKLDIDAGEVALSQAVQTGIEAIHDEFPDVTH